jgi:hypothetical protein
MSFKRNGLRPWLPTFMGLALLAGLTDAADLLLRYEMNTAGPEVQNPVNGVEGQALELGTGVGAVYLPSGLAYPNAPACSVAPAAHVLPLGNAAAALAADCLLSFSFQVGSAADGLNVETLTFDIARGGGDPNRGYGVYVSTPGRVDVEARPTTYVMTQRYLWDRQVIDLSCLEDLQGLSPGDLVTVKIPFWTGDAGQTLELDNISILGSTGSDTNQLHAVPLRITDMLRHADSLSLTWDSMPGRVYAVDYSLDLGEWDAFETNVPAAAGSQTTVILNTAYPDPPGDSLLLKYEMGNMARRFRMQSRRPPEAHWLLGVG